MKLFLICLFITALPFCTSVSKLKIKQKHALSKNALLAQLDYDAIVKMKVQTPEPLLDLTYLKLFNNNEVLTARNKTKPSKDETLCAEIILEPSFEKIGWDKIQIKTYESCSPIMQMWGAGFLEGVLTFKKIRYFLDNLITANSKSAHARNNLYQFYSKMEESIKYRFKNYKMQTLKGDDLLFWSEAAFARIQSEGMLAGHNLMSEEKMSIEDIYFLNSNGEIPELLTLFSQTGLQYLLNNKDDYYRMKEKEIDNRFKVGQLFKEYRSKDPKLIWHKIMSKSHCNAFIKILRDEQKNINDLLVAHSTWDDYSNMIRSFKQYEFEFFDKKKKKVATFSSYPGCISSQDDFYNIDSNLLVMETSLEVLNKKLYKNVLAADQYIPNFFRIIAANRLSSESVDWVKWIKFINTGTYNTQWMILDLKKINQSFGEKKLIPESFFLVEQIPGKIMTGDLSNRLTQFEYWAGYNIPYFKEIASLLGYEDMERMQEGRSYSFEDNERSIIFKKYQSKVTDITSLQWLMELNPWNPSVPLNHYDSKNYFYNNPTMALAVRFDLFPDPNLRKNSGLIDTKATNMEMLMKKQCMAINGPTHDQQEAFQFSKSGIREKFYGLPDKWNYNWEMIDFNKEESPNK